MSAPHHLGLVELYSTREEWLAARHATPGQIGASEVSAVLGVSPHKGPWDVYAAAREGMTLDLPDEIAPELDEDPSAAEDPSDPLVRGNLWEPFVRMLAGRFLGRDVLPPGAPFGAPEALVIVRHPEHPWLGASPDGWTYNDDGILCPVELKTDAGRRGWAWGRSGTIIERWVDGSEAVTPPHYATQCYTQIECIGAPCGYLFVLQGSYRARWFRLDRDATTQRHLVNATAAWRARHIVNGEEPDRDHSDACARHYRDRYAAKKGESRRANEQEAGWILDIAASKAAEKAAKVARVHLLTSMGDTHSALTIDPRDGKARGVRRDVRGILSSFNLD